MEADEVPRPDLVVVSHHHGDHFDAVAADWLPSSVPIVTCPGSAGHLEEQGFTAVQPLRTWETIEHEREGVRLRLTAVPAQHAPGPLSFALPEVTGTVLDLWDGRGEPARHGGKRKGRRAGASDERGRWPDLRLYVSGDTIFNDHLAEIRDRCPGIDIAFVHLGDMRLMGMQVTLDASHGVQLINLLQPRLAIPIHYNDYDTSTSSLAEFVAAVNEAGLADRVRYLRHGDVWPLPLKAPRGGASV